MAQELKKLETVETSETVQPAMIPLRDSTPTNQYQYDGGTGPDYMMWGIMLASPVLVPTSFALISGIVGFVAGMTLNLFGFNILSVGAALFPHLSAGVCGLITVTGFGAAILVGIALLIATAFVALLILWGTGLLVEHCYAKISDKSNGIEGVEPAGKDESVTNPHRFMAGRDVSVSAVEMDVPASAVNTGILPSWATP